MSDSAKILVVDDFEMVRMMLKRCLTQLGYTQIDEAVDGKQALEFVEKAAASGKPYQLVFADWNMPNMTGIDLLLAIRSNPKLKATPVVMVTAESERQYVVQALQAGANEYIVKPFSQQTLQKKIEKISERIRQGIPADTKES